jgi:hypothetical protein
MVGEGFYDVESPQPRFIDFFFAKKLYRHLMM